MTIYIAQTNTYPGFWGKGDTDRDAIRECRSRAHDWADSGLILYQIHDDWDDAYVDGQGYVHATVAEGKATPETVLVKAWRTGPRGGNRQEIPTGGE